MKFFKKLVFSLLATFSFILLILLNNEKETAITKVLTLQGPEILTISGRSLASTSLPAPYADFESYISEELKADFKFSSVGMSWVQILDKGISVQLEIKFKINGKWTDWIEIEEEEDAFATVNFGEKVYGMASTDLAEAFQYKFSLHGNGKKTPIVKDIDYTFINAAPHFTASPSRFVAETGIADFGTYLSAVTSTSVGAISRAQWGADESYRYLSDNNINPQLVELNPEFYDKYSDELQYSRIIDRDEQGNKYKWPLQYPEKVKKFVIHHTATTANLDNPQQAIRDIYHYHAISRGWGDIGYNYIVDQSGKVYEGRYGGEGVIGAHSGPGNHGSIGIAVLGNFQENPTSDKVIAAMSQFIYKKAKIHGIKTTANSEFRGKDMPNIFGHRDIMNTTCPGDFLYNKLPAIRILSSQNFLEKEKFVKDYDFQDLSEIYYFELNPDEVKEFTIEMENIGKVDWNSETTLAYQYFDDFDGVITFPDSDKKSLAKMQQSVVKPGEKATFKFRIKANKKAANLSLEMLPLINGTNPTKDKIIIPFLVQAPIYKYETVSAKFPPSLIKAETEFEGYVKLKNTGNMVWKRSGEGKIDLRKGKTILGKLKEKQVLPGETGTFVLNLKMPAKSGFYKESFRPFVKGFETMGLLSFETTVYERDYDSEFVTKTGVTNFEQGKIYSVSIKLRNTGSQTWKKENLKVGFAKWKDLKITNLGMSPGTISPGEIADIDFTIKINSDATLGKNFMYIRPKINGKAIVRKPIRLNYEIVAEQFETTQNEAEPTIRVKLGFTGDPEITANGSFEIYSGKNLLTTLSAGDKAKITLENGKYKVTFNDLNFLKTEQIRFLPKKNAILQISNFEHRPSWNQELNDNEYRGILEVRNIDEKSVVINELGLESYLKGLGEVSNSELPEKIKTIIVAARTYAKFYIDVDEKFPGMPYNLDDDPDVSQKYLGYGFEKRAPKIAEAVDSTTGKVVQYEGKLVKTPYFNQSDGTKTKSAKEVWGWESTPYLIPVDDSYCEGDKFLGHGVGLSGCGAKGMAEQGYGYEEILQHYYTGIEIVKEY